MSETLSRQFKKSVVGYRALEELGRKDLPESQQKIVALFQNFEKIATFVERLELYNEDERLDEINPV